MMVGLSGWKEKWVKRRSDKPMRRAQSTLEFAMVISCVVAALLLMGTYIRRGIQGRIRVEADQLGRQYDPKRTTSNITTQFSSHVTTDVKTETVGNITRTTVNSWTDYDTTARSGDESIVEDRVYSNTTRPPRN